MSRERKCPLCGNTMTLYCTAHKNQPFIDGKLYPKMCFTCYHVPKTEEQVYDEEGVVIEEISLPYNHRNLHTIKELVDYQIAENPKEAKDSVRAVKLAVSQANALDLKVAKKRPKDPDYRTN